MDKFLFEILGVLKKLHIQPVVYGSFGVSLYLHEFKTFGDIDLLIEYEFLHTRWEEFKNLFESNGFNLIDEQEHEFMRDGKTVGFASKTILIKDKIITDFSELVKFKESDAITLTPYGFLKAYMFSIKDGYRIATRNKKDEDIIRRLEEYIRAYRI